MKINKMTIRHVTPNKKIAAMLFPVSKLSMEYLNTVYWPDNTVTFNWNEQSNWMLLTSSYAYWDSSITKATDILKHFFFLIT